MAIHAERAFFEELLPMGNSFVKKMPADDVTLAEVSLFT